MPSYKIDQAHVRKTYHNETGRTTFDVVVKEPGLGTAFYIESLHDTEAKARARANVIRGKTIRSRCNLVVTDFVL